MTDQYFDGLTSGLDKRGKGASGLAIVTKRKIDQVNPSLRYVGESFQGALDSEAKWRIRREITQGQMTEIAFASVEFNKIWSNRASLTYDGVGAPTFSDPLSTFFDGINDYCSAGDAFNYEHTQQFSASIWIKPNNFAAIRYFLANVNGAVDGWRLGHDTAGKILTQTRVPGGAYASTAYTDVPLTAGAWNHIVFKWLGGSNNNQSRVYVNGVLSAIVPTIGSMVSSWLGTNELQIGRGPANYFSGSIHGVTLWDKALSDAEVLSLYNAGAPTNPSLESFSGNLKNWYRMGNGDTFPIIFDNVSPSENMTCTNMVDAATNFVVDAP